jgi:hypothetical protein
MKYRKIIKFWETSKFSQKPLGESAKKLFLTFRTFNKQMSKLSHTEKCHGFVCQPLIIYQFIYYLWMIGLSCCAKNSVENGLVAFATLFKRVQVVGLAKSLKTR